MHVHDVTDISGESILVSFFKRAKHEAYCTEETLKLELLGEMQQKHPKQANQNTSFLHPCAFALYHIWCKKSIEKIQKIKRLGRNKQRYELFCTFITKGEILYIGKHLGTKTMDNHKHNGVIVVWSRNFKIQKFLLGKISNVNKGWQSVIVI